MGFQTCYTHGLQYEDYGNCPECLSETIAEENQRDQVYAAREQAASAEKQASAARELLDIQRRRSAEEGVCDCCGQRFVERTRVKPLAKQWVGVLARYATAGVYPACANKHGAF